MAEPREECVKLMGQRQSVRRTGDDNQHGKRPIRAAKFQRGLSERKMADRHQGGRAGLDMVVVKEVSEKVEFGRNGIEAGGG